MKKNSTGYTINHTTRTIIITKAFAKKANINGTKEFNELLDLMQKLRGYKVVEKTIKTSDSKQTYSGLTIQRMKDYITFTRGDDAADLLEKMAETEKMGELLGCKYGHVKKWFFAVCPDYKEKVAAAKESESDENIAA